MPDNQSYVTSEQACKNCAGRGHFIDEHADQIEARNGGMFGQCRECLGSGVDPKRCQHGRPKGNLQIACWECSADVRNAEAEVLKAAMATVSENGWDTEAAAMQLCPAVDTLRKVYSDVR